MKINKKEMIKRQALIAEKNINKWEMETKISKILLILAVELYSFAHLFDTFTAIIVAIITGIILAFISYISLKKHYKEKDEKLQEKYK